MGIRESFGALRSGQRRRLPADLAVVLAVTVLINAFVFVPVVRETPLRRPLGLAFLLFVPGYALIAALFPEADGSLAGGEPSEETATGFLPTSMPSGIDWIERLALSFGSSVALVPLIALGLNLTVGTLGLESVVLALTGFTVVAAAVANERRLELPPDERFAVPYREWYRLGRQSVFEPETRFDGVLNVALALSLVLAAATLSFGIAFPPQGEQFSSIALLAEDDDGEYVAAGYQTAFTEGESAEFVIDIGNHERETTDYTVVVLEQATDTADGETVVTEQRELDRLETTIAHGDSAALPFELAPTLTGDDVRIVWLLYGGDVPDQPSTGTTDYYVHLWIDVAETDG
ncbi:DUF1616 domain-containing protein [Natronococcus sp. A-GB7]|uniref:DUF1616 domain-containing protein n=1 Tax=Natronococcus sp. A-GB7 TaxID=3037649 RepID=UPI00241FFDA5|nr:DUF1616 domain-containing protein [Natronococcus sp. A-GB7]MDG5819749.1 DUF1616 domain-containing protein [Natronococcus sp. A-GB7]